MTVPLAIGDNRIERVKITQGGNTAAVTAASALKVDGSAATQPVSGTVAVSTFPDNEPFNLNQLAGTALAAPFDVDTGAGVQNVAGVSLRKSAAGGSVELGSSTDPVRVDPTGTTTQPVSVASFPDNEPFNLNQLAGVALAAPFDVDSGAGAQNVVGVSLRKAASGGSAELGTLADPMRVDPTGTTVQPVSGTVTAIQTTASNLNCTEASAAAIKTAVELIDDAVATDGSAAPTKGIMLAGTDGANAQTVKVDAAGELQIDVLTLPALVAGGANIGDVDVVSVPAPLNVVGGGTEATALRVTLANDSTGLVSVDDNGGSLTVDGPLTDAQLRAAAVPVQAVGNVAHDGIDSGNPVKIGLKAVAHGANPTAVAAEDRTDWYANRHGIPFVLGGHPNVITKEFHFTAAQTDIALVTVAAGTKIAVTQIDATCDNANTVDVGVRVGFAAATLPAVAAAGVAGIVLSHPGIAPGSGIVKGNGSAIIGVGADDEDLRITSEVPTSGSLRVIVSYFTIES